MRLIRKIEAMRKLGMAESTFDYRRRADPSFPRAVSLGRAVAFVESELDEYIAKLPRAGVDARKPVARPGSVNDDCHA